MLSRRILLPLFILALLIADCAPFWSNPSIQATIPVTPLTSTAQKPVEMGQVAGTRIHGCTVISQQPTPNPADESLLPIPSDKDWFRGTADAYVTIIEYGDFQCPGCAGIAPVLAQLLDDFPNDVRVVYRHFPLGMHDKATLAAQAAEAAGLQGRFWEMHDSLFAKRSEWIDLTKEEFQDWLVRTANEQGLEEQKFTKDLNSQTLVSLAKEAYEKNASKGMTGTPFLVINGVPYNGPLNYPNLFATVGMILIEKRQFGDCPPMTIDPKKQYFATLHTEKGNIKIELYANEAPLAVNSFIFLARQGWFDGVTFHRVIEGFVAQAGDPSGTGFGGPGYAFTNEISPGLNFDGPGLVAMANAGPDSNGSQFFITYTATPQLNGGYTIFGRVVSGMDVVQILSLRDPSQSMSLPPGDMILNVTIEEK